jgi:hypothetical protein
MMFSAFVPEPEANIAILVMVLMEFWSIKETALSGPQDADFQRKIK